MYTSLLPSPVRLSLSLSLSPVRLSLSLCLSLSHTHMHMHTQGFHSAAIDKVIGPASTSSFISLPQVHCDIICSFGEDHIDSAFFTTF